MLRQKKNYISCVCEVSSSMASNFQCYLLRNILTSRSSITPDTGLCSREGTIMHICFVCTVIGVVISRRQDRRPDSVLGFCDTEQHWYFCYMFSSEAIPLLTLTTNINGLPFTTRFTRSVWNRLWVFYVTLDAVVGCK